ncbi:MAG TPA: GNAT family N-acetyltransferase [Bryobacteraceae bacterium]|nr:GNAT family N-acetyltransferase [Bryobacteraceae bacterium]
MPATADPAAIREILRSDPAWCVFALADLAPAYSGHARWHVASDGRPALLLVYGGFHPPALFGHGAAEDLAGLMPEIADQPEFYVSVKREFAEWLRTHGYRFRRELQMWRMVLGPSRIVPRAHAAVRLGPQDYYRLTELYRDGEATGEAPPFFNAGMLENAIYYGIRDRDGIIAAAGTPVLAREEGVAAVGTVYTRRDRRGRGYGMAVTAAVTAELVRSGVGLVALNVAQTNAGAIRIYERLGFARYCEYREGPMYRERPTV